MGEKCHGHTTRNSREHQEGEKRASKSCAYVELVKSVAMGGGRE